MKRKLMKIWIPFLMSAVLLAGCQKAPETANDDEILRAKGSSDEMVEAIVNGEDGETGTEGMQAGSGAEGTKAAGGTVSVVLGEGKNRMRIEAKLSAAPDAASILTMQMNSSLNEESLRNFLEPQGEVKDFTEELLAAEEAERQRAAEIDEKLGEGSSIVEIPGVGDKSTLALTDGNRKAVLWGKTGGSYEDGSLKEKCLAVAKEAAEEVDVKDENAGGLSFSLGDAKALLMKKLSVLGVEDIYLEKAYFYEADDFSFFEMQFSPVAGGIPIAGSYGYEDSSRVYPNGYSYVSAEGVAEIGMWNCLMEQVSATEKEKILSFDKIQKLLETYLKDGSLQCTEDVPFSTAELVYGVEQKDGKLLLSPLWSVHMDLGEYVEYSGQTGGADAVWNIYIDAVTGELVEVQ